MFLRPAEAAESRGLSTRAIYRAIQRGELRAVRLCSRLRIPREASTTGSSAASVRAPEPPPLTRTRVYPRRVAGASARFSLDDEEDGA